MKGLIKFLIKLVGFFIVFPLAAAVMFGPIIVLGVLLAIAFNLPDGVGSILSLAIWIFMYTRTSIGGKIGDYQSRILKNAARFFGFSSDSYAGTIEEGRLSKESDDETDGDDVVSNGVCEFFVEERTNEEDDHN